MGRLFSAQQHLNSTMTSSIRTFIEEHLLLLTSIARIRMNQCIRTVILQGRFWANLLPGLLLKDYSEVTRSTLQVPNAHSGQLAPSISSTLALRACSGSFMGLWSKGTNRRFRKRELRFEVIFETPVFIVATPLNNRGPLRNRPIYYIDGTDESFSNTRTINKYSDMRRNRKPDSYVQKANWVHLLEDLQGMEMFSRDWDSKHSGVKSTFAEDPPGHEIAIGIQVQEQSWDRMPPAINKVPLLPSVV